MRHTATHTALTPCTLGLITLSNHLVMAPMTRCRAEGNVPNALMAEYYRQRAGAGLIITEGTSPSSDGLGYSRIPGLFNRRHVDGWRLVTEAVHDAGGHVFVQLMHTGRVFHALNLPAGGEGVAPSAVAATGKMWTDQHQLQPSGTPRALRTDELSRVRDEFVRSATLAIEAGFDGVELHGANGYLLEQFLNPSSNQRSDAYGGSVENRARFVLEVTRAVVDAIGAERTGMRLSPWGTFGDMPHYSEIDETYGYLSSELQEAGLVYLHVVNPPTVSAPHLPAHTAAVIRRNFTNALILGGGLHTLDAINAALDGHADLVSVGRPYIANPDLVARLERGIPLTTVDRATLYAPGAHGYTDYPPAA